ncbi:MAG: branched-chain amino acid ABC transporter permease [Sulfolobales archaeon]|nr:branched-chain amino acid ABC transporter permease [Sulfolobales archaeon]MDW8083284.1 branched-chain amino acid ABC transporter permease [Sulfolobales archaeon]
MLDLFVKAIAYSSCIGIGAASITLIYNTTRTFNFAHASLIAWGMYVVFASTYLIGYTPYHHFLLAALFGGLIGGAIYVSVNRRLLKAKAKEITLMMSTLGVDLILFGFLNVFSDYLLRVYRLPAKYFIFETKDIVVSLGSLSIRLIGLVAPVVLVSIVALLHTFLTKTKLGVSMRAGIENPELASLSGINPEVTYAIAWLLGGALAGLSGGMLTLVVTGYTAAGMTMVVSFFAGAIVGGLYSIYGALLGGFLVGLGEYLGVSALALLVGGWIYAYRPAIPLVVMAATLLIQPGGLSVLWGGRK